MRPAALACSRLKQLLSESCGVSFQLVLLEAGGSAAPTLSESIDITTHNIAADLLEKSAGVTYPHFYVYCEKLTNTLKEKFRTLSGTARMAIEVRASQDRLEGLDEQVHLLTDAVVAVLDGNRGVFGAGMFFSGSYEITYGPVRQGGKHYLQAAKIQFDVDISSN
jgi:hypothetical protein